MKNTIIIRIAKQYQLTLIMRLNSLAETIAATDAGPYLRDRHFRMVKLVTTKSLIEVGRWMDKIDDPIIYASISDKIQ